MIQCVFNKDLYSVVWVIYTMAGQAYASVRLGAEGFIYFRDCNQTWNQSLGLLSLLTGHLSAKYYTSGPP